MKNALKQISKKAFAVVLAVALIATCLTVSFSTFAETTTFKVSQASPLLPLKVEKAIDLNTIEVELGGVYKTGDTLKWVADANNTAASITSENQIVGKEAGLAKFEVGDGNSTLIVWVKVNAAADDDFSLVSLDFANESAFNADDWMEGILTGTDIATTFEGKSDSDKGLMQARSGRYRLAGTSFLSWTTVTTANGETGALLIPGDSSLSTSKIAVIKSPMMDSFKDYSIVAEMMTQLTGDGDVCMQSAPGILARATLNYNAANNDYILTEEIKSTALRFRNFGALSLYGLATYDDTYNNDPGNWISAPLQREGDHSYYTGTEAQVADFQKDTAVAGKVFTPAKKADETLGKHTVAIDFKNTGLKYSLNGNVIFDTIASEASYKAVQMTFGESYVCPTGRTKPGYDFSNYKNATGTGQFMKMICGLKEEGKYGTVGLMNNYGADLYVYSLKVTAGNMANGEMPTFVEPKEAQEVIIVVYDVTDSSPAIPVYAGKKINLENVNIMLAGAKKSAANLEWKQISGVSAKVDDGYLFGLEVGVAGFEVSDGTNTRNIWAIVNDPSNPKFSLVDLDFSNGDFVAEDWISGLAQLDNVNDYAGMGYDQGKNQYGMYSTGKYKIADIKLTTKNVTVGGEQKTAVVVPAPSIGFSNAAIFYKSEILNDFADVTVTADMSYINRDTLVSPVAAVGVFTRVKLNPDAKNKGDYVLKQTSDKSYAFRFRAYGGLSYQAINGINGQNNPGYIYETTVLAAGQGVCWYTKTANGGEVGATDALLIPGASHNSEYTMYPDAVGTENFTNKKLELKMSGRFVRYTLNDHMIFDSSKKMSRSTLDYAPQTAPFKRSAGSDLAANTNWGNNINCYGGGTIAFNNNNAARNDVKIDEESNPQGYYEGCDLYIYDVNVTTDDLLALTEETLPTMEDSDENPAITLTVGKKYDLNKVLARNAIWTDAANNDYQIVDGTLVIFSVPESGIITIEGTRGGEAISADLKVVDEGDLAGERFAPEGSEITCVDYEEGLYNIIFDTSKGKELVPGTLKVDGENIIDKAGIDADSDGIADGNAFKFTTDDIINAQITFTLADATANLKNMAGLGATVRLVTEDTAGAIKFLTRFPAIKATDATTGTLVQVVEGKDMVCAGALVLPQALLLGNKLEFTDLTVDPTATDSVKVGKFNALNVVIEKICNLTDAYADATVTLTMNAISEEITKDAEEEIMEESEVALVPYICYYDSEASEYVYFYGSSIVRSYNQIVEAAKENPAESEIVQG